MLRLVVIPSSSRRWTFESGRCGNCGFTFFYLEEAREDYLYETMVSVSSMGKSSEVAILI